MKSEPLGTLGPPPSERGERGERASLVRIRIDDTVALLPLAPR